MLRLEERKFSRYIRITVKFCRCGIRFLQLQKFKNLVAAAEIFNKFRFDCEKLYSVVATIDFTKTTELTIAITCFNSFVSAWQTLEGPRFSSGATI